MGLIAWLKEKLGGAPVPLSGTMDLIDEYNSIVEELYVREMAFWSAVNIISNAVSKCEFKTFYRGKEVKTQEHYLWNVEPNKNQNSSGFIHKWIAQLYGKNECLIIESNGQMIVADSFNRTPSALYEDVFSDVRIGDLTFNRKFLQSEVLYFKLAECDMRRVVAGLYESYSRLIAYTVKYYQMSRGTKAKFTYEALPIAGTPERAAFDNLINNRFKTWLESDNGIIPIGKGQGLEVFSSKTYSNEGTRDIRAMIDDISDFTAKAFGIPPALLRGDVSGTKDAVENLLTFCIDPLCDMLQEEINRKRNGYAGHASGTYLRIDTKSIKHVDLLSVSTAIDKLISSGAFCVNDIRELVGEPVIDEPWAWQHFITRNYMPFEEALAATEGGEKS